MTAIVPDTMQGALIVSVIDFFLSFVIISGIGVVLAMFPLLNRAALALKGRPPSSAPTPVKNVDVKPAVAIDLQDDIAAVAAAVLVVMDGAPHRILNIEPSSRSAGWVTGGRAAHHGSHRPTHG
jgi:hypothetical protein